MAGDTTYHDRVLAMAERLVREHPKGQELLTLILSDPDRGPDDTLDVVLTADRTRSSS